MGSAPSYTLIKEPLRRLCHRLITFTISGRGHARKKVTTTDLFFLRSMNEGTVVNVPYLLEYYPLSIQVIRLRICERLFDTVSWVAEGLQMQQVGATGRDAQIDPKAPQDAHQMSQALSQQRQMIERLTTEYARYSSWMVDQMTELMEHKSMTYERLMESCCVYIMLEVIHELANEKMVEWLTRGHVSIHEME
ncbi:hypothetical protein Tco_0259914 [Tanacetum coccineum]